MYLLVINPLRVEPRHAHTISPVVAQCIFKAVEGIFQTRIQATAASHVTVVQRLTLLCFYIETRHVYLLFDIALHL